MEDLKIASQMSCDNARLNRFEIGIYGVQPSTFNSTLDDFLSVYWKSGSSLSLTE